MVLKDHGGGLTNILQIRKLRPGKRLGEFFKGKNVNRDRTSRKDPAGSQTPEPLCLSFSPSSQLRVLSASSSQGEGMDVCWSSPC